MGRHRRSAAGRAARGRATGVTHHDGSLDGGYDPLTAQPDDTAPTMGIAPYLNPEAYAETYAKSEAYLFATDDGAASAGTAVFAGQGLSDDFSGGAVAEGGFAGTGFSGFSGFSDSGSSYSRFPDTGHHADAGHSPDRGLADRGLLDDGWSTSSLSTTGFSDSSFSNRDFTGGAFRSDPFPDDSYAPDAGAPRAGVHRRRKKGPAPVRTGLLGVSAAVALGTVAVATGAVPGLENYKLGGGSTAGDSVQAGDSPTNSPTEQGGTSGSLESPGREAGNPASRDSERSTSPNPSPSTPESAPTKTPEKKQPVQTPSEEPEEAPTREAAPEQAEKPGKSERAKNPVATATEAAAAAQVLALVNEERAKAGCRPVTANSALGDLAAAFSEDMARRGFFDHTDPDGDTPWDRAQRAGIADLGGENIARGQADAASVMQAWMDSPGHRANILNCDFKTLGVGVHFGSGGPWWTQNFGY
ncbi:CAP domain-containing protein [Streptomyces sp. NPDC052013]|uniref:CAP domain-containing protein n=1 Tax=Streptomyces sp. NPDC052013 TaxID=3365679 RepID=UPI0037CE65A0